MGGRPTRRWPPRSQEWAVLQAPSTQPLGLLYYSFPVTVCLPGRLERCGGADGAEKPAIGTMPELNP